MLPQHNFRHLILSIISILILLHAAYINAGTLNFDTVLSKAIKHSQDIKIAGADIKISKYSKDEIASLYYPTLAFRLDNEYIYVYDQEQEDVISIGDYVSSQNESTYQHSFTASLRYQLYNFGTRGLKYDNALREIKIAELSADQVRTDIRIDVLNEYSRSVMLSKKINTTREIIDRQKAIYRVYQELRKAGTIGQDQIEKTALNLAESISQLDELITNIQVSLNRIGYYTGEIYKAADTELTDFSSSVLMDIKPDSTQFPEIKAIDERIAGKKTEKKIIYREMLPRLYMYCAYKMYGSDEESFSDSFKDLERRDASIFLALEWEFFSGFRDIARSRRIKEEIKKLSHQKEKRIAELKRDIKSTEQAHQHFLENEEKINSRLSRIDYNHSIIERLSESQITNRVSFLEREIELIQQKLDIEQKKIDNDVACLKLQFWKEGQTL